MKSQFAATQFGVFPHVSQQSPGSLITDGLPSSSPTFALSFVDVIVLLHAPTVTGSTVGLDSIRKKIFRVQIIIYHSSTDFKKNSLLNYKMIGSARQSAAK